LNTTSAGQPFAPRKSPRRGVLSLALAAGVVPRHRPVSAHKGQAIMTTVPIAVKLVPGLLRARGVAAGLKELTEALALGAVPGRKERGRWLLSEADLDAAERYFRERAAKGAWRGGAAARARARARAREVARPEL
jgi:hypothetical protein